MTAVPPTTALLPTTYRFIRAKLASYITLHVAVSSQLIAQANRTTVSRGMVVPIK